ncbi:hypothetical protein F5972_07970 [Microbispora cellulosiformans]|uniref:Uncharacterized protein n=1 Tax=Microbispora cellulosiformans TaxID=2614688 RepID=A0A5J5K7C1_9ACTN|nr:hypothetical protein [Microbispora cellulosiformans]KAA9379584.1 hypothetical protein F5972_07970 [Microbispora cellulosiformans]
MRPNTLEITRCRDCHAEIFFAVTESGARQPLDAEPDPAGPVLARRGAGGWWLARAVQSVTDPNELHPLETRFMPHFATCRKRTRGTQEALPGFEAPSPAAARPRPDGGAAVAPLRRRRR